jgi:hypothetical protein
MEEDLKTLKVEYLSKHCSDLIQILNLSQLMGKQDLNWSWPQRKTTSKNKKLNISATSGQISSKFET